MPAMWLAEWARVKPWCSPRLRPPRGSQAKCVRRGLASLLNVDMLVLIGDDADRLDLVAVRAELNRALDGMDAAQVRQMLRIVRLATRR
jgi:hypothetical protein